MNHNATDEIKVKQEPLESEEEQPAHEKMDLSSSNIKPESPTLSSSLSKAKDSKPIHCKKWISSTQLLLYFARFSFVALFFTCDNCGIRYSNRNTLDAHREHYCIKRDQAKNHSTGKNSNCDKLIFISKRSSIVIKSTRTHTHMFD